MTVAWLVFPLVLAALSLGCGLLLQAVVRAPLPEPLLVPVGFAVVVVASQLALSTSATAELAAPLLVGLAVVGLGLALPGRPHRADRWALLAGSGAFLAFAAPVLLSGQAPFAGYVKLDDTATYLAMVDWVSVHGPEVRDLPPSTYEATLATTLALGYPIGVLGPLAAAGRLVGEDAAWLFQPYLAFLAALLALALYALATETVRTRCWRAGAAVVAAQAALLYGYALWGGVKEVAAAGLVAASAALVPSIGRRELPLSGVRPHGTPSTGWRQACRRRQSVRLGVAAQCP